MFFERNHLGLWLLGCVGVALCGCCDVWESHCAGVVVCGGCGVRKLQCVGVAVCRVHVCEGCVVSVLVALCRQVAL